MAHTFNCPSCGAPLDYHGTMSTIQCPYCLTNSDVPEELRDVQATTVEPSAMLGFMAQSTRLREMAALIRAGQRQKAAALYQQIFQVDPAAAAAAVARLTGGGAVLVSGRPDTPALDSSQPSYPQVFPARPMDLGSSGAPPISYPPPMSGGYSVPVPAPAPRRFWMVGVVAGLVAICGVAAAGAAVFIIANGGQANPVPAVDSSDLTAQVIETRSASLATEQSQSETQIAGRPTPTDVPTATPPPTATDDPGPHLTATAELATQAAADTDLLATAKKWPIVLKDSFGSNSGLWQTGKDDNDYWTGSQTVAKGVYTWEVTAKQNLLSFTSPDPYHAYKDVFLSADVTLTGSPDAAIALVLRTSQDGNDFYFLTLKQNGDYEMSDYVTNGLPINYSGGTSALTPGMHRFGVIAKGQHFVVVLDGEIVDSIDDSQLPSGNIGLGVSLQNKGDQAAFTFDNLEVRAPK